MKPAVPSKPSRQSLIPAPKRVAGLDDAVARKPVPSVAPVAPVVVAAAAKPKALSFNELHKENAKLLEENAKLQACFEQQDNEKRGMEVCV